MLFTALFEGFAVSPLCRRQLPRKVGASFVQRTPENNLSAGEVDASLVQRTPRDSDCLPQRQVFRAEAAE